MNREEFIKTYLQVVHPRPTLTEASMVFYEFQDDIENSYIISMNIIEGIS